MSLTIPNMTGIARSARKCLTTARAPMLVSTPYFLGMRMSLLHVNPACENSDDDGARLQRSAVHRRPTWPDTSPSSTIRVTARLMKSKRSGHVQQRQRRLSAEENQMSRTKLRVKPKYQRQ